MSSRSARRWADRECYRIGSGAAWSSAVPTSLAGSLVRVDELHTAQGEDRAGCSQNPTDSQQPQTQAASPRKPSRVMMKTLQRTTMATVRVVCRAVRARREWSQLGSSATPASPCSGLRRVTQRFCPSECRHPRRPSVVEVGEPARTGQRKDRSGLPVSQSRQYRPVGLSVRSRHTPGWTHPPQVVDPRVRLPMGIEAYRSLLKRRPRCPPISAPMGGPTGACNTTHIIASHTPSRSWAG